MRLPPHLVLLPGERRGRGAVRFGGDWEGARRSSEKKAAGTKETTAASISSARLSRQPKLHSTLPWLECWRSRMAATGIAHADEAGGIVSLPTPTPSEQLDVIEMSAPPDTCRPRTERWREASQRGLRARGGAATACGHRPASVVRGRRPVSLLRVLRARVSESNESSILRRNIRRNSTNHSSCFVRVTS